MLQLTSTWSSSFPLPLLLLPTLVIALFLTIPSSAKKLKLPRGFDKDMHCSACTLIVDEIHSRIAASPKNEFVRAGNFRLDGSGKQPGVKEIPFARSTVNLLRVFDEVCKEVRNIYVQDDLEGKRVFVARTPKEKDPEKITPAAQHSDISTLPASEVAAIRLTGMCESLVDDHEDDLISILQLDPQSTEAHDLPKICEAHLKACDLDSTVTLLKDLKDFAQRRIDAEEKAKQELEQERLRKWEEDRKLQEGQIPDTHSNNQDDLDQVTQQDLTTPNILTDSSDSSDLKEL